MNAKAGLMEIGIDCDLSRDKDLIPGSCLFDIRNNHRHSVELDLPVFVHDASELVYLELVNGHSYDGIPIVDREMLAQFDNVLKTEWVPVLFS